MNQTYLQVLMETIKTRDLTDWLQHLLYSIKCF